MTAPATTRPAGGQRLAFIDALRGIAALSVVVFHVYAQNLVKSADFTLPEPFHSVFANANMGVYVFFVISGFVISYSIRGETITPRYVGWFAARRSLRLDPPYWATIAAMLVLLQLSNHSDIPMPSAGGVISHLFYAQHFVGVQDIVGVFWTLCFEIQFYLALVIGFGIAQAIARRVADARPSAPGRAAVVDARALIFAPLWALAALTIVGVVPLPTSFALYGWPYFFLGVAVSWHYQRKLSTAMLAVIAIAPFALIPFSVEPKFFGALQMSVALATALAIFAAAHFGRLATATLGRATQYLGKISYSLYLVHMLVGTPLVRFGIRHFGKNGQPLSAPAAILLGLAAIAVSIAAAHVMYLAVEKPAIKLSHLLKRREKVAA